MFEWMIEFLRTLDDPSFSKVVASWQRNQIADFRRSPDVDLPPLPKYLMDECNRRIALYREREGLTG